MTADVPVGAFLSGGVDSSAVVALMQAAQPSTKVRTFTVAMPDTGFDESAAAGAVAHHLGTEHTTVELTAGEAMAPSPSFLLTTSRSPTRRRSRPSSWPARPAST